MLQAGRIRDGKEVLTVSNGQREVYPVQAVMFAGLVMGEVGLVGQPGDGWMDGWTG